MGSSRRETTARLLPALLAALITLAGVVLLLVNSVIIDDPGPFSGEPRDYLAVWPAGAVLLGIGSAGLMAAALLNASTLTRRSRSGGGD